MTFQKSEINTLDELIDKLHTVNQENHRLIDQQYNGLNPDPKSWALLYHKLLAFQNRYYKHFGIINYSKAEPI